MFLQTFSQSKKRPKGQKSEAIYKPFLLPTFRVYYFFTRFFWPFGLFLAFLYFSFIYKTFSIKPKSQKSEAIYKLFLLPPLRVYYLFARVFWLFGFILALYISLLFIRLFNIYVYYILYTIYFFY